MRQKGLNPYLRDQDLKGKVQETIGGRRKGLIPAQTRLSVSDVPDYSTPTGAAAANDEMRRLRFGLEEIEDKIEKATSGDAIASSLKEALSPSHTYITEGNAYTEIKNIIQNFVQNFIYQSIVNGTLWALTVLHNGKELNDYKWLYQVLNWVDKEPSTGLTQMPQIYEIPIKYDIEATPAWDPRHVTTPSGIAFQANISADAQVDLNNLRLYLYHFIDSIISETHRIIPYKGKYYHVPQVHLVNDEDKPGGDKFYGTNEIGRKGWQSLNNYGLLAINKEFEYADASQVEVEEGVTKIAIYIDELPSRCIVESVHFFVQAQSEENDLKISVGTVNSEGAHVASLMGDDVIYNCIGQYICRIQYHTSENEAERLYVFFSKLVNAGKGEIIVYYRKRKMYN